MATTPTVHQVLGELWKERRLDTNRVFLYNDKPVQRIGTALRRPVVGHVTPELLAVGSPIMSVRSNEASGRSSVVES